MAAAARPYQGGRHDRLWPFLAVFPVLLLATGLTKAQVIPPLENCDFIEGRIDPWEFNEGHNPGHPTPTVEVEDTGGRDGVAHVSRSQDFDGSHAVLIQTMEYVVAPESPLALDVDVRINSHNFGRYGSWNVYPANVWVDYIDLDGMPRTFRRSFYTMVSEGHTPDPEPLAEQLAPEKWATRSFDLSDADGGIGLVTQVRAGSLGWSYDVLFDNVCLKQGQVDQCDAPDACPGGVGGNGCADLEPQNATCRYNYGAGYYEFSFDVCNLDSCDTAGSTQARVTLLDSQNNCQDWITLESVGAVDPNQCVTVTGTLENSSTGCRDSYCSFRVEVDINDSVKEEDESNNATGSLTIERLPDLEPTSLTCSHDDDGCDGDDEYTLNISVTNHDKCATADVSASSAYLEVEVFNCDKNQSSITSVSYSDYGITSIGPQQTVVLNVPLCGPKECTCCRVDVDGGDRVTESNEGNNTENFNEIEADLIIGDWTAVGAAVSNISSIPITVIHDIADLPSGWQANVTPDVSNLPPQTPGPITLSYLAPPGAQPATIEVVSREVETGYTQNNLFVFSLPTLSSFVRGDVNCDSNSDIADPIALFNHLFLGGAAPCCIEISDANDDTTVNIADGVYLLNFRFLGGPRPPPPNPDCGTDPGGADCPGYPGC